MHNNLSALLFKPVNICGGWAVRYYCAFSLKGLSLQLIFILKDLQESGGNHPFRLPISLALYYMVIKHTSD